MSNLLRFAESLTLKYASLDAASISEEVRRALIGALSNASTRTLGLMPFVKMLAADGASLAINVSRNGEEISVSPASVTPGSFAPKYAALPGQIQNYLSKRLEIFPSVRNGAPVQYRNLTVTLQFNPQLVAKKNSSR